MTRLLRHFMVYGIKKEPLNFYLLVKISVFLPALSLNQVLTEPSFKYLIEILLLPPGEVAHASFCFLQNQRYLYESVWFLAGLLS